MKTTIILLTFLLSNTLFSQGDSLFTINDAKKTGTVRFSYGIKYNSLNDKVFQNEEKYKNIENEHITYDVSGLRLNKNLYLSGELFNLTEKEGTYDLYLVELDDSAFVKEFLFYSKLDAPVILNGEEIEEERIEETLSKIRQEDIISIKKTGGFLRKTRLEIVTK